MLFFGKSKAALKREIAQIGQTSIDRRDRARDMARAKDRVQAKYDSLISNHENCLTALNECQTALQKRTAQYNSCLEENQDLLLELQSKDARVEDLEEGIKQKTTENTKLQTFNAQLRRNLKEFNLANDRLAHNLVFDVEALVRKYRQVSNEIGEIGEIGETNEQLVTDIERVSGALEVTTVSPEDCRIAQPIDPADVEDIINEKLTEYNNPIRKEQLKIPNITELGLYTITVELPNNTADFKLWIIPTP